MSPATPPRLPDYLQHIAQAIQRIQRYVAGLSATAFAADDKTLFSQINALSIDQGAPGS